MAGPNEARRFFQSLGVLDASGRTAPRHRRPPAGIDIDEVDTIGVDHEPEELPPVPRETVVDEIEVIGDPGPESDFLDRATPPGIPTEWVRSPAHAERRDAPPSSETFARAFDERQAARAAQNARVREQMSPERREGNIAAALPEFIGESELARPFIQAAARSPLAAFAEPDVTNAMQEGVPQGLTLGHADELAGAARSGQWSPFGSAEGGDAYRRERDAARDRQDEAQRNAPGVYGGAELLGSLPLSMAVPGAGPGASLTRRALTSAAINAGFGGVSGEGHSARRLDDGALSDAAQEAVIGGVIGGGSELALDAGRGVRNMVRGAPEGTPRRGGDLLPEHIGEIERRMDDGDPDLFDMATTRDALEEAAATRRVRSTADNAALSDVRRVGDYHGPGGEGYRGLARDLDTTGVSPRGSITRATTAQQRAARMQNQAGREIGAIRGRMDAAARPLDFPEGRTFSNSDEELDAIFADANARGRAVREAEERAEREVADAEAAAALERDMAEPRTGGARGGRARPQGASMRERPEVNDPPTERSSFGGLLDDVDEPVPPNIDALGREARRDVVLATDPARVRYSPASRRTEIATLSGRELPDQGTTVERVLREAQDMRRRATTPEQRAAADQMEALARDIDGLEPELYSEAHARLKALDDEAGYGTRYPNAPGNTPERAHRAREARAGVRGDMDRAVEQTLGPDALARVRDARARYGVARSVETLSARGAEREAANLQAGLGDTIAVQTGLNRDSGAGPLQRMYNAAEGVIVNRYLRGLGHTTIAAIQEFQSDAMAREIVRRLSERPVTAPMARALAEAQRRGPRAFGAALLTYSHDSPEAQQVIGEIARSASGDPYEDVEGVTYDDDTETTPTGRDPYEEIEGVTYDDDEPLERRRRQ